MTGKTDVISDGNVAILVNNGHPMLGNITGSGCMVGTIVASFCGAASLAAKEEIPKEEDTEARLVLGDMFLASLGGYVAASFNLLTCAPFFHS